MKSDKLKPWKGKGIHAVMPGISGEHVGAIINSKGDCIAHVSQEYRDRLLLASPLPNVEIRPQYLVTRLCGHKEYHSLRTTLRQLRNLTDRACPDC